MVDYASSTCRICLTHCSQKLSLFESENTKYSDLIKHYLGIELTQKDELPTGLCSGCLIELMTVVKFVSKVRFSCEKLNEVIHWTNPLIYITNTVKNECLQDVMNSNINTSELKHEYLENNILSSPNNSVDENVPLLDIRSNANNKNIKFIKKIRVVKIRNRKIKTLTQKNPVEIDSENIKPEEYSLRTRAKLYNNSEDTLKLEEYLNEDAESKRSSLVPLNFSEEGIETEEGSDPRCVILKKCKEKGLKKDVVKCLTCGLLSINRSAFIVHYRKHTGERPHKCLHCDTSFTQVGTLNTHLRRRHLKEWTKERVLAKKLKRMREKERLERCAADATEKHENIDMRNERCFTCNVCGKNYFRRSSLATHMRHHNVDKQFQCSYCPQKFVQSGMRSLHIRVHHTKEKPFFCHICAKSFVASTALTKHLVSHSDERKFKCEICNKSMKSKDNLKRHILVIHTPAKRKVCDICGATFALTYKLNHHIKVWHINKRSGDCHICKRSFNNIDKHMKRHTGDKPHGCQMCHKTFFKQKNLLEHIKKHRNESATFKCTYENCTSAFSKKCVLDFHVLKYHLKHTPHVCQYCSRGFYRKRDLGKHMKAMHNVKLEYSTTNEFNE